MSQYGQTHFKNLAAFAPRFLKCVQPFGTFCMKGLMPSCLTLEIYHLSYAMLNIATPCNNNTNYFQIKRSHIFFFLEGQKDVSMLEFALCDS